jgi:hypothetical protein
MNSLFKKPFALAMGPQRCGTRWLEAYIRSRGDVCLPTNVKEIFYFDRHFQRGPEFYASHFNPQPQHALVMELSTTAFDSPEAPRYAQNILGQDINLLCPLRDPVSRSIDVYLSYLSYGIVSGTLPEAIDQAPQILLGSRYADNLEPWIERFTRERLQVIFYEGLQENPETYARGVCEALWLPYQEPDSGLAELVRPAVHPAPAGLARLLPGLPKKKTAASVAISDSDRAWLRDRLAGEKAKLEKLLDLKISLWMS